MAGCIPQQATATQLLVLAGLHALAQKLRRPPSNQELADHLGYATPVGVIKPLRALARLGLIAPVEKVQVVKLGFALTPAGRKLL